MQNISIAMDGPAGAGKSSTAKELAKQLKIIYVDTGAMYRAVGLYCLRNNINTDSNSLNAIVDEIEISLEYINDEQKIILNGEDVTSLIRSSEVSNITSSIAIHRNIRLKLVDLQRKLAKRTSVVMDGRDIGTYVLPNASIKLYLIASVEVRAKRRWEELKQKGMKVKLNEVKEEIIKRDERDMNREFAPLKKAKDAIEIDCSNMSIQEVIDNIIQILKNDNII